MSLVSVVATLALLALFVPGAFGSRTHQSSIPASALLEAYAELPVTRAVVAPALAAVGASAFAPPWGALGRKGRVGPVFDAVDVDGLGTWGRMAPSHSWEKDVEVQAGAARQRREPPAYFVDVDEVARAVSQSRQRTSKRLADTEAEKKVEREVEADDDVWRIPAKSMGQESETLLEEVVLPKSIALRLQRGTLEYLPAKDEHANPSFFGVARSSITGRWIKVTAWRADDPASERHVLISEMLSGTGLVPKVHEVRRLPEATYLLSDSPGVSTVATKIEEWKKFWGDNWRTIQQPVVPLIHSVPLMIDMLRGLTVLEKFKVVHGDLAEYNIYIVSTKGHTKLDDFRSACVEGSQDPKVSCAGARPATRRAPEVAPGRPAELSANIWQLGLVFAKLIVGDLENHPPAQLNGSAVEGRSSFDIYDSAKFRAMAQSLLFGDVTRIVAGMLEPDPQARWSPQEALAALTEVAKGQNIRIPRGEEFPASAMRRSPHWA